LAASLTLITNLH